MGRTRWLPFAIVSLLAAAPYLATPGFDFVFDDRHLIVHNLFLREATSPFTAFAHHLWHGTPYGAAYYRPLVVVSFALNGLLSGWGPAGFHMVNVLLHAANAVLLLALTRRLGCPGPAAFSAAALFAVHPVAAWPVASVVARVDLLPAFFILLAWLELSRPSRRAVLVGLFFLVALLCKESSAAFLAVPVLGLRRMKEETPERPDRRTGLALGLAAALYVLLRRSAGLGILIGRDLIDPLINPLSALPITSRIPAAMTLSGRYLLYLLLPTRFHDPSNYLAPATLPGSGDVRFGLSLLALLVVGSAVTVLSLTRDRIAIPLAFAAAAFLPASNLIVPIASLYAQNFLYLPLLGLSVALGIMLGRVSPAWMRPSPIKVACATLVLTILGIASWREAGIWRDEVSLFSALSDRFPYYPPVHSALGVALLDRGRAREAVGPLREALALAASSVEAHYNLGVALILLDENRDGLEEALSHLKLAIMLRPPFAPAHAQAARALLLMGRDREAEVEAREAVRLEPDLLPDVERFFRQKKTTGP
ncbi:MAG TPA: tetratricopeptide repeat protein [Candidatus Dormibacteraeota bacterium]|nr:tetratricopeptide repeat protein [Candidatus Dormibacteraeota bacterium]